MLATSGVGSGAKVKDAASGVDSGTKAEDTDSGVTYMEKPEGGEKALLVGLGEAGACLSAKLLFIWNDNVVNGLLSYLLSHTP
jgi:hypothetical protein